MITDALVNFIQPNTTVSITASAVRSSIIDLLGSGVGTAPANIIGNRTVFGTDQGIGGVKPQVQVNVGTAFSGGTSLQVAFQAAADLGAAGSYQPDTWVTLIETPAILTAQLTASQILARFDFPPAFPANLQPRYLSLLFTPVGTFSAGTITAAPVTMVRDDTANFFQPSNFTVS